ncbi:hypothetical protein AD930_06530 [Acetobacter malorum]|nr:hypothetical protein AD930_06530 [Acetobacter malorum]
MADQLKKFPEHKNPSITLDGERALRNPINIKQLFLQVFSFPSVMAKFVEYNQRGGSCHEIQTFNEVRIAARDRGGLLYPGEGQDQSQIDLYFWS